MTGSVVRKAGSERPEVITSQYDRKLETTALKYCKKKSRKIITSIHKKGF